MEGNEGPGQVTGRLNCGTPSRKGRGHRQAGPAPRRLLEHEADENPPVVGEQGPLPLQQLETELFTAAQVDVGVLNEPPRPREKLRHEIRRLLTPPVGQRLGVPRQCAEQEQLVKVRDLRAVRLQEVQPRLDEGLQAVG
jgi:hypothetical protein